MQKVPGLKFDQSRVHVHTPCLFFSLQYLICLFSRQRALFWKVLFLFHAFGSSMLLSVILALNYSSSAIIEMLFLHNSHVCYLALVATTKACCNYELLYHIFRSRRKEMYTNALSTCHATPDDSIGSLLWLLQNTTDDKAASSKS